jgi:hypothetical protein
LAALAGFKKELEAGAAGAFMGAFHYLSLGTGNGELSAWDRVSFSAGYEAEKHGGIRGIESELKRLF